MPRRHLRTRVLALTTLFSAALFLIAFGLSWRARVAQERWSRIIAVETESIATLEELIRAQNAFRTRHANAPDAVARYAVVQQLLDRESMQALDLRPLRARVRAFRDIIGDPVRREEDLGATSTAIVVEAQSIIEQRKSEIARQLPLLRRQADDMMLTGLAVCWIVMLMAFTAAQTTLRKVVRPIENLADAADRIAAGDHSAEAPIAGDREIARLAVAFNRMAAELTSRARTDDLTALPNFRAFRERIDGEIERASRYPAPFGVLVLDLDRFKQYNDRFGHLAGNDALQRVANALRSALRSVDFAARYGGEEFAVIAPEAGIAELTLIAERIRKTVEAMDAPADGDKVTVSIGGAMFPVDGATPETLFKIADERLYEAKGAGRNCVFCGGAPAASPASGAPTSPSADLTPTVPVPRSAG